VETDGGGQADVAQTDDTDRLHASPTRRAFFNCL